MNPLSENNLPESAVLYKYDRDAVSAGIVHFGIGNFHRAHQAVYCDDLLNHGSTQWGIIGVSLRSSKVYDALESQDYLYTLATLATTPEYRIIGAIKDILVAPRNPQAVIDVIADTTTQVVSSTITEKGYCLDSGKVDFAHPDLRVECGSMSEPKTIYGYLARGIAKRRHAAGPGSKLTIMCCDNISGGGETLQSGVHHLLGLHDPAALAWCQKNVTFVSSMVDRVCPATDQALRDRIGRDTHLQDAWPVSTEPFSQWIIEDGFAGRRPEFDTVGAAFVEDIAPFEQMKLRYLNAAHSIVSTLGYLSGAQFVHEALAKTEILNFTRQILRQSILPNAPVPEGYDGAAYIEQVLERFQNGSLPYATLQVGTDSSQKIQQRWFPTIDQALSRNADTSHFEFCLAAWAVFVQTALESGELSDPKKVMFENVDTDNIETTVLSFLAIADARRFAFSCQTELTASVVGHAKNISAFGLMRTLGEYLGSPEFGRL